MAEERHLPKYAVNVAGGLTVAAVLGLIAWLYPELVAALAWVKTVATSSITLPAWLVLGTIIVGVAVFVSKRRTPPNIVEDTEPSSSSIPAAIIAEAPAPLTESQTALMQVFAVHEGANFSVADLAGILKRDRVMVAFDLDELKHRKFVLDLYASGGPFYRLGPAGRKYSVANKLTS